MEKINFRIQRRNNLNEVFFENKRQPSSNGFHKYEIKKPNGLILCRIFFQEGPRNETDSINGVLDNDLLEIVRHRLTAFQSGQYATPEGEKALCHVEEALLWLAKRADDRDERGVLGTFQK